MWSHWKKFQIFIQFQIEKLNFLRKNSNTYYDNINCVFVHECVAVTYFSLYTIECAALPLVVGARLNRKDFFRFVFVLSHTSLKTISISIFIYIGIQFVCTKKKVENLNKKKFQYCICLKYNVFLWENIALYLHNILCIHIFWADCLHWYCIDFSFLLNLYILCDTFKYILYNIQLISVHKCIMYTRHGRF